MPVRLLYLHAMIFSALPVVLSAVACAIFPVLPLVLVCHLAVPCTSPLPLVLLLLPAAVAWLIFSPLPV